MSEPTLNRLKAAFERKEFEDIYNDGRSIFAEITVGGCTAHVIYDHYLHERHIWLDSLVTQFETRGFGEATNALSIIFTIADKFDLPVKIEAVPVDQRIALEYLLAWYQKRGFVITEMRGSSALMERRARVLTLA